MVYAVAILPLLLLSRYKGIDELSNKSPADRAASPDLNLSGPDRERLVCQNLLPGLISIQPPAWFSIS